MRAYRKVNDHYEFRLDVGRLALLGVGAGLVVVLVFLLGVLAGKSLWGERRVLPPLPQAQVEPPAPPEPAPEPAVSAPAEPARPSYTFYEELKKPDPQVPLPPIAPPEPVAALPASAGLPPAAAPKPEPKPPAPPAATAPRPPAAVFTVQVGSFQDRAAAAAMASEVGAQGVSAQVSEAFVAGRTWYRVQVGQFETRSAAETYYRTKLRTKNVQGFVTTK